MIADNAEAADPKGPSVSRRVTAILYALTEHEGGLSVRAIAEEAGSSRSATHRILQTLAEEGYAELRDQGRYTAGPKFLELAARVFGVVPLMRVADAIMVRLVRDVGETSYLAAYAPEEMAATFVHRVESHEPVRHIQPLGSRLPLHAGAVGKSILAASPKIDLSTLDLSASGVRIPVTLEQLTQDVTRARELGYAVSIEERISDVAAVAAAVTSGAVIVGALTVAIPASRVPLEGLDSVGAVVRGYAQELSATMKAMGVQRF